MANTLMTLLVRLGIDTADFQSGIKGVEKTAVSSAKKMSDAFGKAGDALTVGLTVPLAAAGVAAVKVASDYQETANKARVVFEGMAKDVEASAEKSAKAMGISRRQYLDYASSIAAALKAGGMGITESTKLSESAVKHFADLASFHNAQVSDVAMAWQSAIRGQYEPIQRYFPFITNEYLKTYGIANKLVSENTETLSSNQRAIILNAIAFDQKLNPAIDDFSETADGLANSTRSFAAQLEDLQVALGENLLPLALDLVNALNDIMASFKAMTPEQQKALVNFGLFLAALGPILKVLQFLTNAFLFFAPGGAGAGIIKFFVGIVPAIKAAADAFGLNVFALGLLKDLFTGAAVVVGGSVGVMIAGIVALGVAIAALILEIKYFGPQAWETFVLIGEIIKISLTKAFAAVKEKFIAIMSSAKDALIRFFQPAKSIADFIGRVFYTAFRYLAVAIGWVIQRINELKTAFASLKIPDWLTPGSPTPLEIGIRGINDAMKQAAAQGMPEITAGLQVRGVMQPAAAAAGGPGANTYNITVNGSGLTAAQVRSALIDALGASRM